MPDAIRWTRSAMGQVNIRGDAANAAFASAVERALGMALPSTPNTVMVRGDHVLYWLGPDEWLFVTATEREAPTARALREALAGTFSAVTEVGGGQVVVTLRGANVRELLAKECPLDLDAPAFAPGACAQTRLAKAGVLLRPLEGDAMQIIVRRSFADYVWTWLEDAAAEYGFHEESAAP